MVITARLALEIHYMWEKSRELPHMYAHQEHLSPDVGNTPKISPKRVWVALAIRLLTHTRRSENAEKLCLRIAGGLVKQPDVIFPSGMILEDTGEVKSYYGAADAVICLV
jgi:hypothetical protein